MSSLTDSDMKLLVLVLQHCKEPIQPDYKVMAEKGGYARVPTVQTAWSRLKKKLEAGASAPATGTASSKDASSSKDAASSGKDAASSGKDAASSGKDAASSGKDAASSSKAVTPKKRGRAEKASAVGQDGEGDTVNDNDDDDDPIPAKYVRSCKKAPKKRGIAEKVSAAVGQDGEGVIVNDDDLIPVKLIKSRRITIRGVHKTEEELEDESVFD